jgi:hypothetical protein
MTALEKSSYAALRCIRNHCGVFKYTPHSFGFARLASDVRVPFRVFAKPLSFDA